MSDLLFMGAMLRKSWFSRKLYLFHAVEHALLDGIDTGVKLPHCQDALSVAGKFTRDEFPGSSWA